MRWRIMVVAVGRMTATTEKLAVRVDLYAAKLKTVMRPRDEDEIEECTICGELSKQVLSEKYIHDQLAWKGGGQRSGW